MPLRTVRSGPLRSLLQSHSVWFKSRVANNAVFQTSHHTVCLMRRYAVTFHSHQDTGQWSFKNELPPQDREWWTPTSAITASFSEREQNQNMRADWIEMDCGRGYRRHIIQLWTAGHGWEKGFNSVSRSFIFTIIPQACPGTGWLFRFQRARPLLTTIYNL